MGIGMRKQYVLTTEYLTDKDERVITLLGDIGVYSFKYIKDKHPNQVHNLGILEQSSISVAAGLALAGYVPFFHTIAPFIVERSYEQLKDDFGYQKLGGNFVSVGASYDDGALGTTHYCPADVSILKSIPNMQIIVPGTAKELDVLLCSEYDNGYPTYYRLSTETNDESYNVEFSKANVIKRGEKATVIAIGPLLNKVLKAVGGLDVTVLYYTTISPFDIQTLRDNCKSKKILVCEPYYYGAVTNDILSAFEGEALSIEFVGVPHRILQTYGTKDEIDESIGITVKNIREKLTALIER